VLLLTLSLFAFIVGFTGTYVLKKKKKKRGGGVVMTNFNFNNFNAMEKKSTG